MRILTILLALWGGAATAQSISPCVDDYRSQAMSIAEPWDENTRTFANGNVRLVLLDTIEPALAPMHLLVLSPPYDEMGSRHCSIISSHESLGYTAIFFEDLNAEYVPGEGLHFMIPVLRSDGDTHASYMLKLVLNQATGVIKASEKLTSE